MSNKKKQAILKSLLDKYQKGEERTGLGVTVTDLGKSMTNIQLHTETKIDVKDVDNLCYVLVNQGHVSILQKDEANKAHRYLITQSGQQAVIDNFYINQVWYRQRAFWFSLLPIIVSLSTLVWTITKDTKKQTEIDSLRQEIQILKNKIK